MGTQMAECAIEQKNKVGCGILVLYNSFRRRGFWPRRTASTSSIPTDTRADDLLSLPSSTNSKRRRGGSDEITFSEDTTGLSTSPPQPQIQDQRLPVNKQGIRNHKKGGNLPSNAQPQGKKSNGTTKVSPTQTKTLGRRVSKEAMTISNELDSMMTDHQRSKGSSGLVRASSSNVMLFGHLGNLRQQGATSSSNSNQSTNLPISTTNNVFDYLPKKKQETSSLSTSNGKYGNDNNNFVMGNIVRTKQLNDKKEHPNGSLSRAISITFDPETLKTMGNEEYKKGNFREALGLYDRAIALDPDKASYRSNKSAALTGLGRLLDAVFECGEAIRIDPCYHRAHHRLATLYLRLGESEKALYHLKNSGIEAKSNEISQAQTFQNHVKKCNEAKRQKDWHTVLQATRLAISSGADSALQMFILQAEALLKLHRHEEADATLLKGPCFDVDDCTKFFGSSVNAQLVLIRAQVDMAAGRFENAVAAAQQAVRLNVNNKEANVLMKKARAIALARLNGNELYKALKYTEASIAYSEGLEHEPFNSVLLCNRAACRYKLGQFERAVEDCTNALNLRPSYNKARLRRADCNSKMQRWEASIQDYEKLIRETPGDEIVGRALLEAQVQLKKQQGEDVNNLKFGASANVISNT